MPSFKKDVTTDVTFIGQLWEIASSIVASGMLELVLFVATVFVGLLMRSTNHVWGGAAAKKKKSSNSSSNIARQQRTSPPKAPPSVSPFAQLADDSISMRIPTARVLSRYAELKASSQLSIIEKELAATSSPHSVSAFYQSLIQCACRGGQPELVESILKDMEAIGCPRSIEFYESAMRLLAAKKSFKEALAVHAWLERDGFVASAVTQSCLVSFAAELGQDEKTIHFFENLCKAGPPSLRACMVVLRAHAKRQDWEASVSRFRRMLDLGVEVDGLCLNIVLATGVAAGKVGEAEDFLKEAAVAQLADTISYNTILKGLAQKGLIDRATKLFETMENQSAPNLITYNTMIDAAVRSRNVDLAWQLYDQMHRTPELQPDKCTCSTLVKALQHRPSRQQVKRVLELVTAVLDQCQKDLAGRLLSGVLYAALRISDLGLALETKAWILDKGLTMSEADLRAVDQLQQPRSKPDQQCAQI
jgi:pentatricopeptide repeat protein